jgi:hypothetical protein
MTSRKSPKGALYLDPGALLALLPQDMPAFRSGWIRPPDAERLAGLRAWLAKCFSPADVDALALKAVSAAQALDALVEPESSWTAVREAIRARLVAARALRPVLDAYIAAIDVRPTERERVLLTNIDIALERLSAAGEPKSEAAVRASSDPARLEGVCPHAYALFEALHHQLVVLDHAEAAFSGLRRPRGSPLASFVHSLDGAWAAVAAKPATYVRDDAETFGELIDFAKLTLACVPTIEARFKLDLESAVRAVVRAAPRSALGRKSQKTPRP